MIFIIRVRVDSSVDEQKADITVNDGVTGNAENQFEYVGTWHHDNYQVEKNYEADEHWTNSEGASVNFRFTGTRIKLFGIKDENEGIAGITIDDGEEVMVDCYSPDRKFQTLLFESDELSPGSHTLKVRFTGTKNENASDTVLSLDKAVVTP